MSKDTIKILNFRNLDFDKLEYYQPNQTNYGSHIGNISYRLTKNNVMPVYIETPKLITTSGIVKIDNKFYMEFEIDLSNNDNPFYDFISKFDEKNIINCHFNSKSWFNKQIPYNVIEDYYKSPLKLQSSRKKPIFRVRLPSYRGKVLTEIYNQKKELVDISKIDENDQVVGIIGFAGLRFLSQQFIAEWELYKLKLLKDTNSFKMPSGYLFSDLESEKGSPTVKENSEEVETTVEETPEEALPTIKEKSEEAKTTVKKTPEEAVPTVKEKSEKVSPSIEENLKEVSTPVEETLEEVPTPIEETPEEVPTLIEETPEEVKTPIEEEELKEELKQASPTVEEELKEELEHVSPAVEEELKQELEQASPTVEEKLEQVSPTLEKKLKEELEEKLEEESDDEFYDSEFELDDDLLEGVEVIN